MKPVEQAKSTLPELNFTLNKKTLRVQIAGDWKIDMALPSPDKIQEKIDAGLQISKIAFDTQRLLQWDSSLLIFLIKIREICEQKAIQFVSDGLPEGTKRLLKLASAVPERKEARKELQREFFLSLLGAKAIAFSRSASEIIAFVGEAAIAFAKFLVGRATFRRVDLFLLLQECGAQALPIVSLISVLVGLILGFVSAIELKIFGAQIFIADVVAIGMVRVIGAIMTGIIMAGRTGAAFASQLGTMEVNEEIDALKTLGISPMEFLVLPRMIALIIMMPLLCVYSDLLGILGGLIVGVGMLKLSFVEYVNRTIEAVTLTSFWIGLFHSAVFGVLVALAGCLRGMQSGRSASAVGYAATSAVVTSIVSIIVATAIITYVCHVLGI
jgi:phospholipid/cholesterol/gamma-HCH transport system permease protein